jgi:hypothetical protein
MLPPRLVDPYSVNYMMNTLQQCHSTRTNLYYHILNISVLVVFVLIVGTTLYYCSKDKLSDYEKKQKLLKDQQFIMSKIRFFQSENKEANDAKYSSITNLPYVHA